MNDPMERLAELAEFIPLEAMLDIRSRIADWLIAGGKTNDSYIWQQVRYAENCAKVYQGRKNNE